MKQPKGLKLFDRDADMATDLAVTLDEGPRGMAAHIGGGMDNTELDADQLDKLAERCKQFSAYLRSLPKSATKKPKWEDV